MMSLNFFQMLTLPVGRASCLSRLKDYTGVGYGRNSSDGSDSDDSSDGGLWGIDSEW